MLTTLSGMLRGLGLRPDPGAWVDRSAAILVCAYPRSGRALARLRRLGIRRLLNLHERRHAPHRLGDYGLVESHVLIPDFGAPTRIATIEHRSTRRPLNAVPARKPPARRGAPSE